ncbi:alpha-1,2-mannosidase, putative [Jatrophihabitans endophyticus]|uniref:Alpha-1,2-mannosidase, putative n=1 Tax=Jatrophihabitans endophyticus TaxID=1206085 RepID=A0A1M5P2Q8_9ACTN|nr:GH92 family glycosyl hydrolase [Jatrophihabitans endophyticus]SHG96106.1 alpha-1,2-mannosidase, putative [Jatrophihabitans endophyticus]
MFGTDAVRRPTCAKRVLAIVGGAAILLPGLAAVTPAAAAAPAPGAFRTSFESGEPAGLASTVEVGRNGKPVRKGIEASSAHLPGSVVAADTPITASAENPPGEVAKNLADADPKTKWLAFATSATLTYHLPAAATVVTYGLTSANDAPDRDPAAWTLQGSTDGTTFTTLDTRDAQTFAGRGVRNTYSVTGPKSYAWYRLAISAPHAGSLLQLADLDLAAAPQGGTTAEPMITATGNGPTAGLNIKQNAGFTGLHAYRYAGKQTVAGRAYETNVVSKGLDVRVGPRTRLSYDILPEDTGSHEAYPSTYAAVDLHFTDGTYLSQLSPVDQHGVPLTARGQGKGKILYVDQWNRESSDIGSVARGKTVDRVLLAYDATNAKADTDFAGWVDDVTIDPEPKQVDTSTLTNAVDTRRGTNASGSFSRGNNLPISAMPNGFTFLTPVTDASSNSWEYYYAQANDTENRPRLQGFSVSHEPSPWMGDRNQLSVMPSASATPTGSPTGRSLAFTHDREIARPDYYKVAFLNRLYTEMAPTDHGSVLRFTFPGDSGSLVFDTVDKNGSFVLDPATGTVHGWVDNGSGLSVGRSRMFFTGTFSSKPTATGAAAGGNADSQFARFGAKTVELRLATSFISLAQARRNADLELTGRSFDAIHKSATAAWQQRLGVVEVDGASDDQLRTLYGSLYRLNLYPNSQFENTGTAAAPVYKYASPTAPRSDAKPSDSETSAAVLAGKVYVNNGFWDTYRTVWPAYSLLYPDVAADLVDGFVQQFRDGGWVARWSSPGYADLMTGTSSDVAFAGAYLRGVKLKDPLATYEAALKNATTLPSASGVGRKGLATSLFRKYTDTGTGESVSWQLEGDINDAGLAQMAAQLAKDPRVPAARRAQLRDEAAYLADRAGQYVNLFDKSVGFFQGRKADGSFNESKDEYDPEAWGGVYTETDGWNFAFHAPQDGQGLADLYGGRKALAKKLDAFFSTPELANKPGGYGGVIHEMVEARAVRMGQYGHSNQVSHHIPYMYDYVQQPYKTQRLVREVMQRLYVGSEIGQGYTGDEDNGEMSAWYVLSSLGLYPLQSGSPNWAVGSPLFDRVVVHRSTGDLTINARHNSTSNVYVQSLKIDGRKHASTSVSTAELAGVTDVDFTMGSSPSTWGTGKNAVPDSPTSGTKAPQPDEDATSGGVGTLTAANGQDIDALTDDDSTTQTTFRDGIPTLSWTANGSSQRVSRYTLTSGSAKGDPSSWTLEGSTNGRRWTTVDSRSGQTFPWRGETRPFSVAHPRAYTQYRLLFTGGGTTSLAEVELLVKPGSSGSGTLAVTPTKKALTTRTGSSLTATLGTFVAAKGSTADDYSATLDWGDGTTSAGTLNAGQLNSYSVRGTHEYAKPGFYRVAVTVTNGGRTATGFAGITVAKAATGGIVPGFDGVCIADDGVKVDCDGGGYSYSRQALAAAGAAQGDSVAVPGTSLHFTLPAVAAGTPDNAKGSGQTIPVDLPKDATKIAFIGAGTEGDQKATATLTYSDGSSESVPMNFPDWTLGGGGAVPSGYTAVAATQYRLDEGGRDGAKPYLFAAPTITLTAGKTLTGVVMPQQPGTEKDQGRVHVFAIADDGTPAPALRTTAADDANATTGSAASLTLGKATGGSGDRSARVQWGDASPTADATIGADGTVTGSHTWTAPGSYTVHVTVSDGQSSDTTALTVTVADRTTQTVSVRDSARPGTSLAVTGRGFRPGETVAVALATPRAATTTVTADGSGRIAATVPVASAAAAGVYAVTATGSSTRTPATATTSVTDPVLTADAPQVRSTLVLSSTTATPGERVTASGTGYRPNRVVTVSATTADGATVTLGQARANPDGVVTTSFVIPNRRLVSVGTDNAAAQSTPRARTPFAIVATPHGTDR